MPGRKKWASEEKAKIVMETLTTNIPLSEICRKYNVGGSRSTSGGIDSWKEAREIFLATIHPTEKNRSSLKTRASKRWSQTSRSQIRS